MNKIEDKVFGARRLLNERRKRAQTENMARRNPEKFKKVVPAYVRRLKRGT